MKPKRTHNTRNKVLDPEHPAALVVALRKIDPNWSGKRPSLPKPIDLCRADGSNPVDEVLSKERDRRQAKIKPERIGADSIRIFLNVARELALSPAEQVSLLRVPEGTYERWRETALADQGLFLDDAVLERISHVLIIHRELTSLFHGGHGEWLRRPNTGALFGGITPLDLMISDPDGLANVHTHLECFYGGWA